MRAIRYVGAMLIAGLLWVVVSALLRSLGLGQGATTIIGFVLLFVLSPLLLAFASGGKSSRIEASVRDDGVQAAGASASPQVQVAGAPPKAPETRRG